MKYDVAIIGAGVTGSCIARELSKYQLKVALIDKECDVSFGVSKANSGIIHGGFHTPITYLKSKLEIAGNQMFDDLQSELHFPFKRCGIIVAAFTDEDIIYIENLYNQGIQNGVPGIELCSRDRILELEPFLSKEIIGGLHAPNGGIIEPYRFAFSMVESAVKNKVELKLNFNLIRVDHKEGLYTLTSRSGEKIETKHAVNCGGLYADQISSIFGAESFKISARKGEEYLLDKNTKTHPHKVIFPVPSKNSKGMLVIPTVEDTIMVGPTAEHIEDKYDLSTTQENRYRIFESARRLVPGLSEKDIITSFAGLRPAMENGDFYIDISKEAPNLIQVAGIQSPGLTASPAIALFVKDLLIQSGLKLNPKPDYNGSIPKPILIRNLSLSEAAEAVKKDNRLGNIVCRCEMISEAEIVEAIKKGHTTLDGIKFYTRSGMGRCQGGFCTEKIISIIIRETGLCYNEITKRGGDSYIIKGHL